MPPLLLDIILAVLTLALFYLFDRYTVGCEKI
jgi:hypothetical protein